MSEIKPSACLVCRKHRGQYDLAGGIIYEDDLVFISHAQLWGDEKEHYLGHVFVESKRHVAEIADLTDQESQALGLFTSRTAKALLCTQGMEHVYSFFIGDGVPHVHIHVIGRYPHTPKEYWGPKVDEWPKAPKGTTREIEQVATRLRNFFHKNFGDTLSAE
ncbi:MAG: HIT family protein [Anaerolineales bacterium]|nr:HIT family protein [Anaerolineales bacterium]